jgi:tRNA modification GTPase
MALSSLTGISLPEPRRAALRSIREPSSGEVLDHALVLRFPGPQSSTGEDVVELHLHGGRSVVAAVLESLSSLPGLRSAQPGEFTRQAFENGRIDLAEAEGLADLLAAETQSQRRVALALADGVLSRRLEVWQSTLLELAAQVEAVLDFSDEGDVGAEMPRSWSEQLDQLTCEIEQLLRVPPAERLRDGIRVVIAGPPNAGKSSLLNKLAGRSAAIISAIAGTTRDVIEAPVALAGTPFLLVDTAGLRVAWMRWRPSGSSGLGSRSPAPIWCSGWVILPTARFRTARSGSHPRQTCNSRAIGWKRCSCVGGNGAGHGAPHPAAGRKGAGPAAARRRGRDQRSSSDCAC